ncbi:hypothetical protein K2X92_05405 [Candidatus Gracilibacteria bacterium]|nr:hypothetical protein [Candidatus Gracilibacteria bacterium]
MKPIQKYIILTIGLSLFLLLGYIGFQNHGSSQLDESLHIETNTNLNPHINTGANNTPKPTTLSDSGNVWGGNPFQTGTTNTGEGTKPETPKPQPTKVVFQKPNTEWKSRTLSGITYVFGEGNPKEVALDEIGIQKLATDCADMPRSVDITPTNLRAVMLWENDYCDAETSRPRYLSRQVEFHLMMALSHPNWQELYTKCEANFRFGDSRRVDSSGPFLTFDQVFLSGTLDINNFILIDKKMGWKKLNTSLLSQLTRFLESAQLIAGRGEVTENPHGDCVDIYGQDILDNLQKVLYYYGIPLGSIKSDFS